MAELIGGSGYDDVQSTAPTSPSIGDTWLDTSTDPPKGKIYADLGSGGQWTTDLIDEPISAAGATTGDIISAVRMSDVGVYRQNTFNIDQYSINDLIEDGGDYRLINESDEDIIADFESGGFNAGTFSNNRFSVTNTSAFGYYAAQLTVDCDSLGGALEFNNNYSRNKMGFSVAQDKANNDRVEWTVSSGYDDIITIKFMENGGVRIEGANSTDEVLSSYGEGTIYDIELAFDWANGKADVSIDGVSYGTYTFRDTLANQYWNKIGASIDSSTSCTSLSAAIDNIYQNANPSTNGEVQDLYSSPTSGKTAFKQWESIKLEGANSGGSTSSQPIKVELYDSSNSNLHYTEIPPNLIADKEFKLRNREFTVPNVSDGQETFAIDQTGNGGHFGIDINSIVSISHNGSIINTDYWSWEGDNQVNIDTSNVTINSGDNITIKYDFDIFDNGLKPKIYLSRESASEESPTVSHFIYRYVI